MRGVHDDVVFGAWRLDRPLPYVSAMMKLRAALPGSRGREMREAGIADPARFGLTPEEVEAIRAVLATLRDPDLAPGGS